MNLQSEELQQRIDQLYQTAFAHPQSNDNGSSPNQDGAADNAAATGLTEEAFGRLGRTQPEVSAQQLFCTVWSALSMLWLILLLVKQVSSWLLQAVLNPYCFNFHAHGQMPSWNIAKPVHDRCTPGLLSWTAVLCPHPL